MHRIPKNRIRVELEHACASEEGDKQNEGKVFTLGMHLHKISVALQHCYMRCERGEDPRSIDISIFAVASE